MKQIKKGSFGQKKTFFPSSSECGSKATKKCFQTMPFKVKVWKEKSDKKNPLYSIANRK